MAPAVALVDLAAADILAAADEAGAAKALIVISAADAVISSEVARAVAVVDVAAADILAAADESGAADFSATPFTGHFFKIVNEM